MRHSLKATRWMRSVLVGSLLLPLSFTAFAAEPTQALMMKKADKSLLLDIQRQDELFVAVGERGHILTSTDLGKTWTQSPAPTAQMLTAVYFVDAQHGWAVGHDGNIVHSNDGGKSWVLQRDGLEAQVARNQQALANAIADVSRLQKAIDAGEEAPEGSEWSLEEQLEEAEWSVESARERLKTNPIAPPLMDVWFADKNNGWAVGSFGILLQTTDGGKTWVDRSSDIENPEGYHLNAVVGSNGVVYLAGEVGLVTLSRDNGATWELANLDYDGTLFGIFVAPQNEYVIATGLRGNTFKSVDAGVTWQAIEPNSNYSLAAGDAVDGQQFVLVGAGGAIVVSRDGGESFENFTLPSRAALSSVLVLEGGQLVLVGQGGVHHFNINAVAK